MRSFFICAFAVALASSGAALAACGSFDSGDVEAPSPGDSGSEASAVVEVDAAGIVDAAESDGFAPTLSVSCGALRCSGATPVCCYGGGVHECLASPDDCPTTAGNKLRIVCDDRFDCAARGLAGYQCCLRLRDSIEWWHENDRNSPVREALCAPTCEPTYELPTCRADDPASCDVDAGEVCRHVPTIANYGDFRVCD